MQIHVAGVGTGGLGAVDLVGLLATPTVDTPATTVWDPTGLLDVDMHHMTGPAGDDPAWLAVVLAVRVEEPAPVQAEVSEVQADGVAVAGDSRWCLAELAGPSSSRSSAWS